MNFELRPDRPRGAAVGWLGALIAATLFAAPVFALTESLPSPSPPSAAPRPPVLPSGVSGKEAIKIYLVNVVTGARDASIDLQHDGGAYASLVKQYGSAVAAANAQPQAVAALIEKMRNEYKRIDSYGYEYVEGIVAGVPSLIKYDVELDSGVPEMGASIQDQIADIHIHAGGVNIDRAGSLNNFLIEPTVYGTNAKFTSGKATLSGFKQPVNLPNAELIVALANYSAEAYGRLLRDGQAWQPSDRDLFQAMVNMTPTLADYFDDWKESKKYGQATGGRFVAVSRVSDMRGIMASTQLNWEGMEARIEPKDRALAEKISQGYEQIMHFIDTVDSRDQAKPLRVETIDALGAQAKERADKLTVQVAQAASLLGLDVNGR